MVLHLDEPIIYPLIGWVDEKLKQISLNRPLTDEVEKVLLGLISYSNNTERAILKNARKLLSTYELEKYIEAYTLLYQVYRKTHGLKAENLKGILEIVRDAIYRSIDSPFLDYINKKIQPEHKRKLPLKRPITKEKYQSSIPFHWRVDFGHIIRNGGFDVVIGNPPYVRVESLDHKVADIYKALYESVYQRCDIYVAFMQTSFERINGSGMVGLITANQYMVTEYGRKIRKMLATKFGISKIVNFTHYSVFPGVSIYTAILIGSKVPQQKIKCMIFRSKEAVEFMSLNGLDDDIKHPHIEKFIVSRNRLNENEWILKSEEEAWILEKIELEGKKLRDISLIGSPLKTGRDSVLSYKLRKETQDHFTIKFEGKTRKLEKGVWKKIIRPRKIHRWNYEEPKTIVFFPYKKENGHFVLLKEKELKNDFPLSYRFVSKFKDALLNRKDSRKTWQELGRKWYSLHRVGIPQNYYGTKILTQSVVNKPTFCIDTNNYFYPTGGVLGIVPNREIDPYFLIAYLNSSLVYYLLKSKAPVKRGGWVSLNVGIISDIPVPLNEELSHKLSNLTKKIFEGERSREKIEQRINIIIYSFFEITSKEQEIIEESLELTS